MREIVSPLVGFRSPFVSNRGLGGIDVLALLERAGTTTRANATATYIDANGVLQIAPANTPRWDYANGARGLLVETSRTNSLRNSTMAGAVAPSTFPANWMLSTNGGLTETIVGIGTVNGMNYIDIRVNGIPTGTSYARYFDNTVQIVAAPSEVWSGSFYVALVGGSLANMSFRTTMVPRTAAGSGLTFYFVTETPNATLRRVSQSNTMPASTERIHWGYTLTLTVGVAVDATFRIAAPQLEIGPFPSSVVPTSSAAVTRNNDIPLLLLSSFPGFNAAEGTFVLDIQGVNHVDGSNTRRYLEIGDNSSAERFILGYPSLANDRAFIVDNNTTQADLLPTATPSNRHKLAFSYKANDFAMCVNGGAVSTDTGGTLPTVDRILFGHGAGAATGTFLNGWIYGTRYYPTRLVNSGLQSLSV